MHKHEHEQPVTQRSRGLKAISCFLETMFGACAGSDGALEHGQLPVWDGATKRTRWYKSIDEAAAALASDFASEGARRSGLLCPTSWLLRYARLH